MIEIRGVQFINKGAELMLHAILQKVSKEIPGAKFTMVPGPPWRPWEKIAALGIYPKLSFSRCRIPWDELACCIPDQLRKRFGMVLDKEVNVVLDASGFAYSDQWGLRTTAIMARAVRKWKRRGTRVILLPQAFGPFTSPEIQRVFRTIAENAYLIYPRDEESYNHIVSLVGERDNIRIAPDFTVLLEGIIPEYWDSLASPVCIVPNYRMVDKTADDLAKHYIEFLSRCVRCLQEMGQNIVFLIHEGRRDYEIAQNVCQQTRTDVPIITEEDVFLVKGALGASKAVIASRYHALISALSQGVPSLGTGWSHKYSALFQDYGVPECLLSVDISDEELRQRLATIVEELGRSVLVNRMQEAVIKHQAAANQMWDEVLKVLNPD